MELYEVCENEFDIGSLDKSLRHQLPESGAVVFALAKSPVADGMGKAFLEAVGAVVGSDAVIVRTKKLPDNGQRQFMALVSSFEHAHNIGIELGKKGKFVNIVSREITAQKFCPQ